VAGAALNGRGGAELSEQPTLRLHAADADDVAHADLPGVVLAVAGVVGLADQTRSAIARATGSIPRAPGSAAAVLADLARADRSAARLVHDMASVGRLLTGAADRPELQRLISVSMGGTRIAGVPGDADGALAATLRTASLAEVTWSSVHRVAALVRDVALALQPPGHARRMELNAVLVTTRDAIRHADTVTAETASAVRSLASVLGSAAELPRLLAEARAALHSLPGMGSPDVAEEAGPDVATTGRSAPRPSGSRARVTPGG
jgi:hypothetical protein